MLLLQALLPPDPGEEVVQGAAGDRDCGHSAWGGGRPGQAGTWLCHSEDGRTPEVTPETPKSPTRWIQLQRLKIKAKKPPSKRVKSRKFKRVGLLTVNRPIPEQWSVPSPLWFVNIWSNTNYCALNCIALLDRIWRYLVVCAWRGSHWVIRDQTCKFPPFTFALWKTHFWSIFCSPLKQQSNGNFQSSPNFGKFCESIFTKVYPDPKRLWLDMRAARGKDEN